MFRERQREREISHSIPVEVCDELGRGVFTSSGLHRKNDPVMHSERPSYHTCTQEGFVVVFDKQISTGKVVSMRYCYHVHKVV